MIIQVSLIMYCFGPYVTINMNKAFCLVLAKLKFGNQTGEIEPGR